MQLPDIADRVRVAHRSIFAYALVMNTRDQDAPELPRGRRLQFDGYVLDLERGCLLLNDDEIVLRPKTFAVLRHLVENSGRLVSKDELFGAVWNGNYRHGTRTKEATQAVRLINLLSRLARKS